MVSLIIAAPIHRYLHRTNDIIYMYSYIGCFDAIAYGALAALVKDSSLKILKEKWVQYTCIALLAYTYLRGIDGNEALGFSIIAASTALLLLTFSTHVLTENIILKHLSKFIQFLGRLSYELYLFHIIILGVMRDLISHKDMSMPQTSFFLVAFLAVSTFFAYIISRFYAEPINKRIRELCITSSTKPLPVLESTM